VFLTPEVSHLLWAQLTLKTDLQGPTLPPRRPLRIGTPSIEHRVWHRSKWSMTVDEQLTALGFHNLVFVKDKHCWQGTALTPLRELPDQLGSCDLHTCMHTQVRTHTCIKTLACTQISTHMHALDSVRGSWRSGGS
jgi:hypothetical protein